MLDQESKNIDAVIVTIPDFMHPPWPPGRMERGKHVYVQKPLTRTVWEARRCCEAANKYKVATQMGNQGYSNEGTRQCAEMIWAGEIGNVTEVHAWTDRPHLAAGRDRNSGADGGAGHSGLGPVAGHCRSRGPTPPAAKAIRSRHGNFYQPSNWRGFYDFGCGALGDMACHILGAPNLALKLGVAHQRGVRQEGRHQRLHVPQEVDHPVRFPGARQHAAGENFLV